MANVKIDLAQLLRHINSLKNEPKGIEEEMELDFYKTVSTTFFNNIGSYSNLIPIDFEICTIEKAKEFALAIGLHIVEGGSGTTYLSISKGL